MRRAGNLDVRTMIFDVEPLVTYWGNKVCHVVPATAVAGTT